MRSALAAAAASPVALTLFLGAGFSADDQASDMAGVKAAALPALGRQLLPEISRDLAAECPDLPALWLVAEVQAESAWNPSAYSPAGAAGLLQMMPATWAQAGGEGAAWSPAVRPAPSHPVWNPSVHLRVAIRWMCGNLHLVQAHLQQTHKPTEALDALAVCHIAGCSRVTGSATGVPKPGEAGCAASCARQITDYLLAIHHWVQVFSALPPTAPASAGAPAPYPGGATGCVVPDPTGTGGCVTGATAWLLAQVAAKVHRGPVTCWDAHAWNPTSDHPKGRACDYTIGRLGDFPRRADVLQGWALAAWLRAHAAPLHVAYVIFQARIWSASRASEGWRPYSGGGVYDPTDPTGGHYDHVHVSLTE